MEIQLDVLTKDIDETVGYRRLYGPLGHSTGLGLILIPMSGYFLFRLESGSKWRYLLFWGACVTLTVLTGSRTAVFGQAILLVFFMATRYFALFLALLLAGFIATIVLGNYTTLSLPAKLDPLKVKTYIDVRRIEALRTSLNAWLSSPLSIFFGARYSELVIPTQKWYLSAAGLMTHGDLWCKYGFLPGGTHSILNWVLSSWGIVGLILRCSFVYVFVGRLLRKCGSVFRRKNLLVPIAVTISFLNLFTDGSHVTYPMLMSCWFVFYIFAYDALMADNSEPVSELCISPIAGL